MSEKLLVLKELKGIFKDVFDDDNLEVEPLTTAEDVDGWDSLAHIRLVVSIEKAFSMRFTASEISELENVGDLVELIILKKQSSNWFL